MGVRVTSQGPGKNVMVSETFCILRIDGPLIKVCPFINFFLPLKMCAQRYQQWSPSPSLYVPRLLTGQCYLLGDNLRVGKEERAWRRVVCDSEHLSRRQMNHEWFAYCQTGHGASFAKDNRSLLFGAPGAYQWRGEVQLKMHDFCTAPTKRSELTIYNRCCTLVSLHAGQGKEEGWVDCLAFQLTSLYCTVNLYHAHILAHHILQVPFTSIEIEPQTHLCYSSFVM